MSNILPADYVSFNINNYVYVRLNEMGKETYRNYYKKLGMSPPRRDEDKNGYSRWQLWHLMQIFGPDISLGFNIPFETTILIGKESLS